ncbi:hypothetical protein SCYAM73S_06872 [Streptomyces cyaneofuscatus]
MQSYPLPPDALARIYRALATIQGIGVTDHLIRDACGRQVIAVTRAYDRNTRSEIFIDPVDYSYAGQRDVVTRTHEVTGPEGIEPIAHQRGDILLDVARTRAAVVDAKGQKPAPVRPPRSPGRGPGVRHRGADTGPTAVSRGAATHVTDPTPHSVKTPATMKGDPLCPHGAPSAAPSMRRLRTSTSRATSGKRRCVTRRRCR